MIVPRGRTDMDSQRLILFFVFSFSVFLLIDGWQRDEQSVRAPIAAEKGDKSGSPASAMPTPGEKLAATQASVPKGAVLPGEKVRQSALRRLWLSRISVRREGT